MKDCRHFGQCICFQEMVGAQGPEIVHPKREYDSNLLRVELEGSLFAETCNDSRITQMGPELQEQVQRSHETWAGKQFETVNNRLVSLVVGASLNSREDGLATLKDEGIVKILEIGKAPNSPGSPRENVTRVTAGSRS